MALTDITPTPRPQVVYLFPELDPRSDQSLIGNVNGGAIPSQLLSNIFVFQFWPTQVQDSYATEYASKVIPGLSHPLYQYIAGSGRTISFEAIFTSEIDEDRLSDPQNTTGGGGSTGVTAQLLPSSRYTVNVAAAINRLQSFQYPSYVSHNSFTNTVPPPKLNLVIPGSRIGRGKTKDSILCFLRSLKVTHESSFPSGTLRIATASLEFVETIQTAFSTTTNGSSIVPYRWWIWWERIFQ